MSGPLQHVALETARDGVEAEVAFWALLGFERIEPPPSLADASVWVARDGAQIHLLLSDAPVAPPEGHAALDLGADYEPACERLRAAGFEAEPRTRHWGAARTFTRSPGGHRVELMAAPPAG